MNKGVIEMINEDIIRNLIFMFYLYVGMGLSLMFTTRTAGIFSLSLFFNTDITSIQWFVRFPIVFCFVHYEFGYSLTRVSSLKKFFTSFLTASGNIGCP